MEFIQSYEEFDKYYMSNLNEFDDSINSELHHENYYIKSYQSLILPNIYNKIDNKEFMYIVSNFIVFYSTMKLVCKDNILLGLSLLDLLQSPLSH